MESKRYRPATVMAMAVAAAWFLSAPASAQTVAYINLLQFDLHSFRSQATGGIFHDDVDRVANAARLLEIDGDRLYTNLSNLNDNATLGDPILTYSRDLVGGPSEVHHFGTGSFLTGWIGRYSIDSDYVLSGFIQRNGGKSMFEDLEDGTIDGGSSSSGPGADPSLDAEFRGVTVATTLDPDGGSVVTRETTTADLMSYDERDASSYDLGMARGISEDLDLGGRLFYRKDTLDRNRGGTTVADFDSLDTSGMLVELRSSSTAYSGGGDEAFLFRERGISLNADYHPWSSQGLNVRLDLYGTNLTNPAVGLSTASSREALGTEDPVGVNVDATEQVLRENVGGSLGGGLGTLDGPQTNTSTVLSNNTYFSTGARGVAPLGTLSVDDERTGIGVNFLVEYDRVWHGGDTRTWAGLSRRPFDIQSGVVSRALQESRFWWNDGGEDTEATETLQDERETVRRDGDMSATTLEAGTRYWRELSGRVNVGLGVTLTRTVWSEQYVQSVDRVSRTGFDDGDPDANVLETSGLPGSGAGEFSEITTTRESTATTDVDDELRNTVTRLPVGAQFRFGQWTWNMGLTHAIFESTRETVTSEEGGEITTTVDDPATPGAVVTGPVETSTRGETTTDRNRWNQTTYWYGLEWLFADSAQININGFFDTHAKDGSSAGTDETQVIDVDFFRNLSLSITFLFN